MILPRLPLGELRLNDFLKLATAREAQGLKLVAGHTHLDGLRLALADVQPQSRAASLTP